MYDSDVWTGVLVVHIGAAALVMIPATLSMLLKKNDDYYFRFVVPWIVGFVPILALQNSYLSPVWGIAIAASTLTFGVAFMFKPQMFSGAIRRLWSLQEAGRATVKAPWGQILCGLTGGIALAVAALTDVEGRVPIAIVGAVLVFAGLALRALAILERRTDER